MSGAVKKQGQRRPLTIIKENIPEPFSQNGMLQII
jgi:hypothetical protein